MATVVAAPPAPPLGPIPEQKFNLWFVGVFIMTLGTCMQAFGGNLQRLSARREESKNSNPKRRRKVCKQPLAIFGIIMLVGGGVVSSAALAFSAQSILAPLILLIFISNPVFAHYINDEPFKRRTDGVCTLLIMGSVALVISFAPHHSASYNADHLKWLFQQSAFVAFLCIVFSAIFASWYVKRRIFQRLGQDWTKLTELRDLAFVHISYGVLGGTFGGMNITFTKAIFTIIVDTFEVGYEKDGVGGGIRELFLNWILYVLGFSLLLTFFLEVKFTSDGLQVSSAMIVVSTLAVSEEIIATLGALLYFQDFHYFTDHGAVMFTLGTILGLSSVIAMCVLRLRDHPPNAQADVAITQIELVSTDANQLEANVRTAPVDSLPDHVDNAHDRGVP